MCGLESEDKSASLAFYSALSNSLRELVGERFVEWLCGSTGGGKPKKQAQQTANRVLRYLRFCCADEGDELTEETIDFCLGSPSMVCRFVDAMQDELKLGHSAQLGYLNAISELTDYRKVSGLSVQVLSSFATTGVYMKRARKTIAKKMKIQWARDLDVDTLEARGSWASLEDLSKVIPYHLPRLNSVLECCKTEATSVTPADLTFATRFLATSFFALRSSEGLPSDDLPTSDSRDGRQSTKQRRFHRPEDVQDRSHVLIRLAAFGPSRSRVDGTVPNTRAVPAESQVRLSVGDAQWYRVQQTLRPVIEASVRSHRQAHSSHALQANRRDGKC